MHCGKQYPKGILVQCIVRGFSKSSSYSGIFPQNQHGKKIDCCIPSSRLTHPQILHVYVIVLSKINFFSTFLLLIFAMIFVLRNYDKQQQSFRILKWKKVHFRRFTMKTVQCRLQYVLFLLSSGEGLDILFSKPWLQAAVLSIWICFVLVLYKDKTKPPCLEIACNTFFNYIWRVLTVNSIRITFV